MLPELIELQRVWPSIEVEASFLSAGGWEKKDMGESKIFSKRLRPFTYFSAFTTLG